MSKKINLKLLDSQINMKMLDVEDFQLDNLSYKLVSGDPWLISQGVQVIEQIPKSGFFFLLRDPKDNYVYRIHETLVGQMYSIRDLEVKRTYYLDSFTKSKTSTTQEVDTDSLLTREVRKEKVSWSDMDQTSETLDGEEDVAVKPLIFDELNKMIRGLHVKKAQWNLFCTVRDREKYFKYRLYMIEYLCLFIDVREVVDKNHVFSFNFFQKKLNEVNALDWSSNDRPISIFGETSGFSPLTRFHLQSMKGGDQRSFLRALVFYCLRSILSDDEIIDDKKIKEDFKTFLIDVEGVKKDLLKIVKINRSMLDNQQVKINYFFDRLEEELE